VGTYSAWENTAIRASARWRARRLGAHGGGRGGAYRGAARLQLVSGRRWIRSACNSVLRATLADYRLTQYRPSVLAVSVLDTVTDLLRHCRYQHQQPCSEDEQPGVCTALAETQQQDADDLSQCATDVNNFLRSTAARLLQPAAIFY